MTGVQCGRDMNIIHFCRVISKSLDIKVYFVFHSMSSSKIKPGFPLSIRLHMCISFPTLFENWWCVFMMVFTIITSGSLMFTSAKSSLFISSLIYYDFHSTSSHILYNITLKIISLARDKFLIFFLIILSLNIVS